MEGGHATSDVVTEKAGSSVQRKNLGTIKYEPITMSCGLAMSRAFYEWITESMGTPRSREGAIHFCDYDGNVQSTLEFHNALITETAFPALDAASKDNAKLTIQLVPEFTRTVTERGKKLGPFKNDQAIQKKWLPANFRLEIQGVDCTRVSRIEAITINHGQRGGLRIGYAPANAGSTNVVATVEESRSADFSRWMESTSRNPNAPGNKKPGQLLFLGAEGRETLFELRFADLGIRRLIPEQVSARSENVRRVKAEMYFQGLQFHYGAVWA